MYADDMQLPVIGRAIFWSSKIVQPVALFLVFFWPFLVENFAERKSQHSYIYAS